MSFARHKTRRISNLMGGGREMSKNGEEADSALVRMSTQSESWCMLVIAETTVVVAAVKVTMDI